MRKGLGFSIGYFAAALAAPVVAAPVLAVVVAPAAANSPLYENIEILGALDCEVDGDIRLTPDSGRALKCDYTPRGVPGTLKRYRGFVRELVEAAPAGENDFACWTVMRLVKLGEEDETNIDFKGAYTAADIATLEDYQLKDGALLGGEGRRFALEPRCVEPRKGTNRADVILRFEIDD